MKLAEMVDMINKAFLDAVIEKMDKLMNIGGFDVDGDLLTFWVKEDYVDDDEEDDDDEYECHDVRVPFNMMKLRAGDMGELGTAISIIDKIEIGEYQCVLTMHGGIDLGGIFE